MAIKRPAAHVHPARQGQVPEEPKRKRQKPNNLGSKSFKKAHPTNEIKSRIRSLRRLLERNDALPATVRVEKERELQSAQHELAQAQQAQLRSDMISRYHKIRFFDRKKAIRRSKNAWKALQACANAGQERDELVRAVDAAQVDVNYAIYYPLDQAYVSLFPTRRKPEVDKTEAVDEEGSVKNCPGEQERQGDAGMWERVKQSMADGTLDDLRNGKLTRANALDDHDLLSTKASKFSVSRGNKDAVRTTKSSADQDSGHESEGFFE